MHPCVVQTIPAIKAITPITTAPTRPDQKSLAERMPEGLLIQVSHLFDTLEPDLLAGDQPLPSPFATRIRSRKRPPDGPYAWSCR